MGLARAASRTPRRWIALGLVPAFAACGLVSTEIDPETVELLLDGPAGAEVILVTSNSYTFGGGGEDGGVTVELFSADTTRVTLAHSQTLALAPTYLFYAQAIPVDPDGAPFSLRMEVRIDGSSRYDKAGMLGDDVFEYAYAYR